ncbi:MAG TPA: YbgC/FadM family acyl-CoA thioesterase [Gammaproteobacteria bacterium]|nr:YbgC/FadM family acyl-CoA thioesterase [Gammaproteobacteria bacterium]
MKQHEMILRVYYADTDAIGIVYHANYLRFLEAARTEYLRAMDIQLPTLLSEYGVQFAVVHIDINYHKAARLDDELLIVSTVSHIGRASVNYGQEIYRLKTEELLCTAKIKLAVVDQQMRPCAVPEILRRGILHDH